MTTVAELSQELVDLKTQADKTKTDIMAKLQELTTSIAQLNAQLQNEDTLSDEAQAALQAVTQDLTILEAAVNPPAPTPVPTP